MWKVVNNSIGSIPIGAIWSKLFLRPFLVGLRGPPWERRRRQGECSTLWGPSHIDMLARLRKIELVGGMLPFDRKKKKWSDD